ncbi:MAG: hypothetical protein FRX49_00163 [Trebouxia sp. A1-2]|nr:MAG: hypothetical protein FRX49_00163 [Trebouxia sp. A1-2]
MATASQGLYKVNKEKLLYKQQRLNRSQIYGLLNLETPIRTSCLVQELLWDSWQLSKLTQTLCSQSLIAAALPGKRSTTMARYAGFTALLGVAATRWLAKNLRSRRRDMSSYCGFRQIMY